ncbi:hypothetical protein HFO56_01560 [Rhizobium laguerreae]|uniref:hypothetical protein n=1 Tax=Rhizobium laguerreae TaxID=1076926 RepID=UPI001C904519|nr:hypothetical protein [Rhizobium laguerreae]MBY3151097.1 hypothetical protein [Rhizobium laguerreae]
MEKTFQQILAIAERDFQASPHSGGNPYQAMENAAFLALCELSDLQIGQIMASRPNAFMHTLREEGPANRTYTLRDAALKALVMEIVLCIDIGFLEPEVYRESDFGAPDYLRDKVRRYLAGPTAVSVTAHGIGSPRPLGA